MFATAQLKYCRPHAHRAHALLADNFLATKHGALHELPVIPYSYTHVPRHFNQSQLWMRAHYGVERGWTFRAAHWREHAALA